MRPERVNKWPNSMKDIVWWWWWWWRTALLFIIKINFVPWLRRLDAGLSQRRFRFNSGSIPLGFMVDKSCTGTGVSRRIYSSPLSVTFRQFSVLKLASTIGEGRGGGVVKTQLSCILFITLTTTCFGHCEPSSGHKNVYRGNVYRVWS